MPQLLESILHKEAIFLSNYFQTLKRIEGEYGVFTRGRKDWIN